ncbi:dihydroxyacetone kinase family protein [uncultured Arsenicicoccus sp.]|uniref:dihydroxyacetone kinase family protein n=2 Tax=uncultured Arsenicicoccus sp. TaxID=491339 RepID=UPI00259194A0|nr:dihydroxyacetone kinase family protein [uncultured Arsenicicoccus sp.]
MKKFLNDAGSFVRESLEGLALTQPGLALLEGRTIAVQADRVVTGAAGPGAAGRDSVPVALISGGGAGHEPAHAGFVADGMLTAAVSGGVFASPSVDAVLDGIRAVTGTAGALLIVKSYTGDRLNFGLAAQLAQDEGYAVETVVVGDDIALGDADTHAGARGLAGTVLVHKIAGALAASGADLAEVSGRARSVASRLATMGVALRPGTMPGSGEATFEIDEDRIELGLGIHGESGVEQVGHRPADDLAAELADRVLAARPLDDGARVALLVNGLGGTPPAELAVLTRAVHRILGERGLTVERAYQGSVMTSLEMAGASVTVLPLEDGETELLDAPTASLAWPGGGGPVAHHADVAVPDADAGQVDPGEPDERARAAIDAACQAVLDDEHRLTELDQVVGDGDLGEALARGARAWQDDPADGSAASLLRVLSARCRRAIGGTSGPLYAAGLVAAAQALEDGADWPRALAAGVDGIQDLGGASPGDGTMVDALRPAADAAPDGWEAVLAAAEEGVRGTVEGVSRKGRASYVGVRGQGHADPGAEAVLTWLRAVREAVRVG